MKRQTPSRYGSKSLRRERSNKKPRSRILILCEGAVTEPNYFKEFIEDIRNPCAYVEVDRTGGSPKTLVERAADRKKKARKRGVAPDERFDEYWCVFDVDQHPKLSDAKQQARDNNICLAVSNPCFELWILLHFQECTRYEHRHGIQSSCRHRLPGYSKYVPYWDLKGGYSDAVRRAQELEKKHAADGTDGNPSTSVYRLTERLLGNEVELECNSE